MNERPAWLSADGATVMAIVNVNADSFSDPRADHSSDERIEVARAAVTDGAVVIDLGAQSAATHLPVVDPDVEVAALAPVVAALAGDGVAVSIDTYKPDVAGPMLDLGATIINDYSGLEHPEVAEQVADAGVWYVLTHNRGRPKQRLTEPTRYADVTGDVIAFFMDALTRLERLGLASERVILDPGVDLSKTPAQTMTVLRQVDRLAEVFSNPQLWAVSRKDVLGVITGRPPAQRDAGTLALVGHLAGRPDTLLRVHDVRGTADYLAVHRVLTGSDGLAPDDLLDPALYREAGPAS
jgi:dihydropteroate synthase